MAIMRIGQRKQAAVARAPPTTSAMAVVEVVA